MAIGKCRECGVEVSDQAKTCPKCGVSEPVRRRGNPGLAIIFLGIVGLAALGSVISGDKSSSSPSNPSRVSAAPSTPNAISSPASAPAPTSPPPAADPVAQRAKNKSDLNEIRLRIADSRAHLKKYYGTAEHLKEMADDGLKAAAIAASLHDSKDPRDQKLLAEAKTVAAQTGQQARAIYASYIEEAFVKSGMDAKVRASGKANERLTITYVLMSQPMVYKFQNELHVSEQARKFGFTKVVYTNGFQSSLGETWTITP